MKRVALVLTCEPAAEYTFPEGAPVLFGTPPLIRQACRYYAAGLALQILRRNPMDELAASMFAQARALLWIPEGGHSARACPGIGYEGAFATVPVIA